MIFFAGPRLSSPIPPKRPCFKEIPALPKPAGGQQPGPGTHHRPGTGVLRFKALQPRLRDTQGGTADGACLRHRRRPRRTVGRQIPFASRSRRAHRPQHFSGADPQKDGGKDGPDDTPSPGEPGAVVGGGGKAANIGEISNRVHLPVPRGFAVTAYAYDYFMASNGLYKKAERILKGSISTTRRGFFNAAGDTGPHSERAPSPRTGRIAAKGNGRADRGPRAGIRVAVRSSATSEDSEASFAGQHSSVLGVNREGLLHAYKTVLASTYNPRAVYYRRSKGYPTNTSS